MSAFFIGIYHLAFGWDLNDSVYFIIVTSTTVGYGDVLPETDAEKIMTIFTMLISTVVMGKILGDAVNLYVVDILEERIKNKIISSATYVHHCDLQVFRNIRNPNILFSACLMCIPSTRSLPPISCNTAATTTTTTTTAAH